MKIENIHIQNFRGFKDVRVDFHAQLNVFIGNNGAGKTSLLDAIVKTITSYIEKPQLNQRDINYEADYYRIILKIANSSFTPFSDYLVNSTGLISPEEEDEYNFFFENESMAREALRYEFSSHEINSIPIIKYFTANKKSLNTIPNLITKSQDIRLTAWRNIYQNSTSYYKMAKWFYDQETKELRLQRNKNDFSVQIHELKWIRKAIEKTLSLLYPQKNYKINSDQIEIKNSSEPIPVLTIYNEDTEQREILDYKSEGEKHIIGIVADIAYNLAVANNFNKKNKLDYTQAKGVVFIDEIGRHLHPSWQRQIIAILIQTFPNIQFFITTHSPQVIASVANENLFVCDNFKIHKNSYNPKGRDTNSLLKYVFESTDRPKELSLLIDKFYELIDKEGNHIEQLERYLQKIKSLEIENAYELGDIISELTLFLESYKFDIAHESN